MPNEHTNPKTNRPALKLSDTQLMLLSAAAQRDDLCLIPTSNLRGGAAHKVAEKLIAAGFVKEVLAKPGAPVWRRDEKNQPYALKLTAAGSEAIGVDQNECQEVAGELETARDADRLDPDPMTPRKGQALTTDAAQGSNREGDRAQPGGSEAPRASPRAGSKLAEVIDLLSREEGATIGELIAATSWLAHTTRAALTGLRKRGYEIERVRSDRITHYRISNAAPITRSTDGTANESGDGSTADYEAA